MGGIIKILSRRLIFMVKNLQSEVNYLTLLEMCSMAKSKGKPIKKQRPTNPGRTMQEAHVGYKSKSLLNARNEPEFKTGTTQAIYKIKRGISQKELLYLKKVTDLDYEKLAFIVGLTRQTLAQKPDSYTYDVPESDKIYRIADLYSYGYDVFENKDGFNEWMRSENPALGNQKPIDFLDTMYGFQEVKNLIGRIDYGVYS